MLMEHMKEREKSLMIPPVLAATHLDRSTKCFWLKNSETQPKLSSKPSAYKRLPLLKHQEDSLCSREVPSSMLVAKTMNLHLCSWCLCPKERRGIWVSITSLINFFDLKNYTKVDCTFHYWAEQNSAMAPTQTLKIKRCINSIRQWRN